MEICKHSLYCIHQKEHHLYLYDLTGINKDTRRRNARKHTHTQYAAVDFMTGSTVPSESIGTAMHWAFCICYINKQGYQCENQRAVYGRKSGPFGLSWKRKKPLVYSATYTERVGMENFHGIQLYVRFSWVTGIWNFHHVHNFSLTKATAGDDIMGTTETSTEQGWKRHSPPFEQDFVSSKAQKARLESTSSCLDGAST